VANAQEEGKREVSTGKIKKYKARMNLLRNTARQYLTFDIKSIDVIKI